MKKLLILMAVAAIFSVNAFSQSGKNVPAKVKTAFSQKFPSATHVSWDKENESEWEAEFKMNGKSYSANFSTDGTWKETEYRIKKSDIPIVVKETLNSKFAEFDIEKIEVPETADGKVFEFKLESDESDVNVSIAPDGKIVRKEEKKENEEEEEGDEGN